MTLWCRRLQRCSGVIVERPVDAGSSSGGSAPAAHRGPSCARRAQGVAVVSRPRRCAWLCGTPWQLCNKQPPIGAGNTMCPVIGITGSVGKTISKEAIAGNAAPGIDAEKRGQLQQRDRGCH